jgi:hypothetical protein
MPNELNPSIGQWYMHRDKGEMFQVVAVDAASGCIETQAFDGDLEEVEAGAWPGMDIERAPAPEDWTGPFDDIEPDDLGLTETAMSSQDWRRLLEPNQAAEESWQDARVSDELDEEEVARLLEP